MRQSVMSFWYYLHELDFVSKSVCTWVKYGGVGHAAPHTTVSVLDVHIAINRRVWSLKTPEKQRVL